MATLNHRIRTLARLGGEDRSGQLDHWLRQNPAHGRALLEGRPRVGVADALSALTDALGIEPESHNRRLGAWCTLLAEAAGLPVRAAGDLHAACLVHDIGKIAVPDAILQSPHALEPTALDRVKMHSTLGHAILFGVEGFRGVSETVLRHHEYWDGSGYHGVAGRKIPRASRLFALVDSYDAMLRIDRPYRVGVDERAAREEILRLSGKRYDPEVVECWAAIDPSAWNEILERIPDADPPRRAGHDAIVHG